MKVEEKKMAKNLEVYAHGVANKMGFENVPWFQLTQFVLGIYSMLTILVLFFRTDFINVSALLFNEAAAFHLRSVTLNSE